MNISRHHTPATLIDRLADPSDDEAWETFYSSYTPLIIRFCLDQGCTMHMAEEVLQEVMVSLLRIMHRFSYDRERGRFRAYLRRVVDSRMADAFRRRQQNENLKKNCAVPDDELMSSENDAEKSWDRHWRLMVLREAIERVRAKVNDLTFRSFEMYVLQEIPVETVAATLDLKPNAIYQHKQRLMRLIQAETALVTAELGEETLI